MKRLTRFNFHLQFFIIFLFLLTTLFQTNINISYAADNEVSTKPADSNTTKSVSLNNPLTGNTTAPDINTLIGQIINGALGIVGSLALLMFIYGGFMWMLSAGSSERVKKGKDILIWATLGLVIIFSAYALVHFLFTNLFGATG